MDPHQVVDLSVSCTRNVQIIWHVCNRNAEILVQARVVKMQTVACLITTLNATAVKASGEILSLDASLYHQNQFSQLDKKSSIHVNPLHVVTMRNVRKEMEQVLANVYQNTSAILTRDVVQSVCSIKTVLIQNNVSGISVQTHVSAFAEATLNAQLLITLPTVIAYLVILEIRSSTVPVFRKGLSLSQPLPLTHVNHRLVDLTVTVATRTVLLYVHVAKNMLDHHQTADQNVHLPLNVPWTRFVKTSSVLTHVLDPVLLMLNVGWSIILQSVLVHRIKLVIHSTHADKL